MSAMRLHQQVYDAGQELLSTQGVDFHASLISVLNRFLGPSFAACEAKIVDAQGNSTDEFGCVVFIADTGHPATAKNVIPADAVAAVIDVHEEMDLDRLRAAHQRIAQAKRLKKTSAPCSKTGEPRTTVTLGVILASHSTVPLESLADELARLNRETPGREWPDMVAVVSAGVISYGVRFPGEPGLADYLPPAEDAVGTSILPAYILILVRPTADFSFNKMLSFLTAHLALFCREAILPRWDRMLEGVPDKALVMTGFQYDLQGELLPVPRQFYNDRYLPPPPVRIEDQQGELLCTLQFLPWQDGGVILLRGKLPLEGILFFLNSKEVLERLQVLRLPDAQISTVLPIKREDFANMLRSFQAHSNMAVKPDQTGLVVQKIADEGSRSPFMARLYMGVLRLRDEALSDPAERVEFDRLYEVVMASLMNARRAANGIPRLLREHKSRIMSGAAARVDGRTIHINESIDDELRREAEGFINAAVRVLKQGMQGLAKGLHVDLGFLFQGQAAFEAGIASLGTTDVGLADYLQNARQWTEPLVRQRNAVEHQGWVLPRITYSLTNNGIRMEEPLVSGQPVTDFVRFMLDRLCCFVEDVTIHCLRRQLPSMIELTEIPLAAREKEMPTRFRLTLSLAGEPAWRIAYHSSAFEET